MTPTSYYELLALPRSAGADAIKRAFREQARLWHPDRNPDDPAADDRFKAINEAYRVLSDPNARAAYDEYGALPAGSVFGAPHSIVRHSRIGATLRRVARAARRAVARPGDDILMDVQLDFVTAALGSPRVFELPRRASPQSPIEMRRIEIHLPPGVHDGALLRWRGEGHPGDERTRAGDLLVRVAVTPDTRFRLSGRDVVSTHTRSFLDFAEGASVEVETVHGVRSVDLSAGTQPGSRLRIEGAGVPGPSAGDHVVEWRLAFPETLTEAQRDVLRELGEGGA